MHVSALVMLLLQITVIVAVGQVLAMGARRVGQPAVVAQVIAGIALGPSALGLIWPDALHALWAPESLGALNAIGQFGLVLFMFLIGLEFDLSLIRGLGRASVIISQTSIVAPFAMGIALAWPLYGHLAPAGVPFLPFALFLGVAMSITAFPVLARILAERQALRTRIGAIALACAAVDDVTAWCVLAFVVSVARSEGLGGAMRTTLYALVYVAVVFAFVRPLLARIGARTREGASQGLIALVFLLVLVSAGVTETIGIHALFGAFLMGVVMPRESGFTQALIEKLEDVVVILLLPVFFACSGLRTDLGLMNTPTAWIECAGIIVVACAGKFGGSLVAARVSGLTWQQSSAIGILMNTRGLMQLVVLNIGLELGVISPELFAMMVVMAIATTIMTSPALEWVYPRAQILREQVPKTEGPGQSGVAPEPKRREVLLCVSDPTIGAPMVTLAARLTRPGAGGVLVLRLLPVEKPSQYLTAAQPEEVQSALAAVEARGAELGIAVPNRSFPSAKPARDICRVANEEGVGLILLGSHRPLLQRTLLGGVVSEVVALADMPVGVLIDRGLERVDRVLLAVDESADGEAAASVARRLQEAGAALTEWRGGDGDRTEGLLAESEKGYDLVVVGMNATWDLDPTPTPWHRERLADGIATTLLAVRAGEPSV
jgi:Kef-type K+ transport system membrane component KefB/nucleotide-binding universal stress UspA family protein